MCNKRSVLSAHSHEQCCTRRISHPGHPRETQQGGFTCCRTHFSFFPAHSSLLQFFVCDFVCKDQCIRNQLLYKGWGKTFKVVLNTFYGERQWFLYWKKNEVDIRWLASCLPVCMCTYAHNTLSRICKFNTNAYIANHTCTHSGGVFKKAPPRGWVYVQHIFLHVLQIDVCKSVCKNIYPAYSQPFWPLLSHIFGGTIITFHQTFLFPSAHLF